MTRLEPAERDNRFDRVRWCDCGQPWIPAAGLYGTTEETQCCACVLRRLLHAAEQERDTLRNAAPALIAAARRGERLRTLADILDLYATHYDDCAIGMTEICTCGLTDVRRRARAALKEKP